MSDPERIWLQSYEDTTAVGEDRLWCEDKVWPANDEDHEPTEYILASRISQQDAELERWKARAEAAEAKLAETRRVAFIEAAEIAEETIVPNSSGAALGANLRAERIAGAIRAKAEETGR